MPPLTTYPARDGAQLAFRFYPGDPARIVVIVHGSSSNSASLHPMAKASQADGFTPLFEAERSDIPIKIIPGLGHTEMSVMPEALSAFVEALGE